MMEHVFEEFDGLDCTKLGYCTDVEGNLDFWNKYVDHSKVMHRDSSGKLVLHDKCRFVYGGDTCDRGYGDLHVLRDLISLKETYPERVHLIMGNRDINKLRLPVAMHPQVLSLRPTCYWAPPTSSNIDSIPEYLIDDPVSKIKWVLTYTMGSPYAFEYRRLELQRSNLPSSDLDVANSFRDMARQPTSADDRFSASGGDVSEGAMGLMVRYLELAQIVLMVGDVMFLHGGIHDYNLGWVPITLACDSDASVSAAVPESNAATAQGYEVDDPVEWCRIINAFAASEVRNFKLYTHKYLEVLSEEIVRRKCAIHAKLGITDVSQYSARQLAAFYASAEDNGVHNIGEQLLVDCTGGYLHPQPGSALLQYGMGNMPSGASTRSVVYSSYLHGGKPNPCSEKVALWLQKSSTGTNGIRKLVVGHQPHADAPLILNVHGIQIFSVDSSYSINTLWAMSQLNAMFDTNHTSADRKCGMPATPPQPDEKWLTFVQYCQQHPDNAAAASLLAQTTARQDSTTAAVIPTAANTRSLLCIAEFLFVFGGQDPAVLQDHNDDSSVDTAAVTSTESVVQLHGVLSQGSHYYCCLSGDSRSVLHTCVAAHSDPYMGRQTPHGWFVKAAGVKLPNSPHLCGTSDSCAEDVVHELHYLLAQSASYDFKNRLVPASCIQNEFLS